MGDGCFGKGSLRPVEPLGPVCYFLGAGFSAACCQRYPTSVGFLTREFDCFGEFASNDTEETRFDWGIGTSYLEGLLPRLKRQYGPLDALNLEDVMTDLHIRAFGLGRAWEHAGPQPGHKHFAAECRRDYEGLLRYIVRANDPSAGLSLLRADPPPGLSP
jgi:hypothetical protein